MKAHIAGIGGEGWSWIAKVLLEIGWEVTGCDSGNIKLNPHIKELSAHGLKEAYQGNSPTHITKKLDYFLYTSALLSLPINKREFDKAQELNIKCYDRNKFFPLFLKDKDVIAVAGTHGKTTTSGITAFLLDSLGDKCGFGVGGTLKNFRTNGRVGESANFVIEADEFGDAFLGLTPKIEIITHLENDHTDYFPRFNDMVRSYDKFVNYLKNNGVIIYCKDNPVLNKLVISSNKRSISYGFNSNSDWVLTDLKITGFTTYWTIRFQGKNYKAEIPFPGTQYALNATAGIIACYEAGYDIAEAVGFLKGYQGVERRFEINKVKGITIVNDYGHHPTEILTTIKGAKGIGKRLIVIFEPHQYKRCFDLKKDFERVFDGVDILIQTEIFASREIPPYPITNEEFFKITKKGLSRSYYIQSYHNIPTFIKRISKSGDLILVFAVGHGGWITEDLIKGISQIRPLPDFGQWPNFGRPCKILVMGLGVNGGGVAVARYFAERGDVITITDLKNKEFLKSSIDQLKDFKNIKYHLGFHDENDFRSHDLVIRNPGVPRESKYLQIAKEHGAEVTLQEGIFFKNCPTSNIIGVTGTKGKTTTAYLIYEVLKANGKKVHLAGNMQLGVLDILSKIKKDDFVVLELSSWQCEALDDVKMSPRISVITNIYPDHLNRYKSYRDYAMSKSSIFKYQEVKDHFITVKGGKFTKQFFDLCISHKHLIGANSFKVSKPLLTGEHNLFNMMVALKVSEILKLDFSKSVQAITKFKGVPYRQENIGIVAGVPFINDTTATNPTSAIVATQLFKSQRPVVILGGADKELDFSELVKYIAINDIKYVLLRGLASDKLVRLGFDKSLIFNNFADAISEAFLLARRNGGCVLLSPGAASFGLFKNEFDRGDQFNGYFNKLKKIYQIKRLPKCDSRLVEKGDVFVAIKGVKIDSHQFIEQVAIKGVAVIIGENYSSAIEKKYPNTIFLKVLKSREIYSDLCAYYNEDPQNKLKIIGITGTDGKTTTCHFLNSILNAAGFRSEVISTVSSPGLHTTTPDPDILFKMLANMVKRKVEYCVLEVTSHALDQSRVSPITYTASCITNVTPEHLDAHGTYKNYLQTKAKIFLQSKAVYLNSKGRGYESLLKLSHKLPSLKIIREIANISYSKNWSQIFPGSYNVQNAVCAASLAKFLNISNKDINMGLNCAIPPEGRFEFVKNNLGINIVIDFVHTPNALESLLKTVKKIKNLSSKIITVFGCAGERDHYKRPKMGVISSKYSDFVVVTSEDPRGEDQDTIINDIIRGNPRFKFARISDRGNAIKESIKLAKKGDWVLICGKGHEKSMNIGGVETPWDDKEIIGACLKLL